MNQTEDMFGEAWINEELTPDTDAEEELGSGDGASAIADEDIRGSRFLLAPRSMNTIQIDGRNGALITLACTFQAAAGARFDRASIVIDLGSPEWARFVDVAPREVREQEPVKFAVDRSGKVTFRYASVEANFEASHSKEYAVYRCLVTGSGEGTRLARWEFSESPDRREGLPVEQRLLITLAGHGRFAGVVSLSARLRRPGFSGAIDRVRELAFGGAERVRPIAFEVPRS